MNCTLATADRGYDISACDGLISLASGLSGLPYARRHWELSNKCDAKYSVGHRVIAILEFIPVLGALASLIERIVIFIYCKIYKPQYAKDIDSYKLLKFMDPNGSTPEIWDEFGSHSEKLLGLIGQRVRKKAVQISKGRALIIPHGMRDTINIAEAWERMVKEEVSMSNLLAKIGLLSALSTEVAIKINVLPDKYVPAYVCETFDHLAETRGIYVIDRKNPDGSTWKPYKQFIFKSDEERLNAINWNPVMDSMLTDIAKMCVHDIPGCGDSLNLAIVRKPSKTAVNGSEYEVRYFGFGFSCSYERHTMPKKHKIGDLSNYRDKIRDILDRTLDAIFDYETKGNSEPLQKLKADLMETYTEKVLGRIKDII